jgi:hypothetical protein
MVLRIVCGCLLLFGLLSADVRAQVFPPGTFFIDGIPIVCGMNTFVLTSNFPDSGMNNGAGTIFINPILVGPMPTVLKLYVAAHECGHSVVGADEVGADCWAVRTGRDQGWFPPQAFQLLMQMFAGNPGDLRHPPGQVRVQAMWQCYNS